MMLEVSGLCTYYGASQALFGVELGMQAGEVATLMGRNGMGKTTTVNSIMGLVSPASGRVTFEGQEIFGAASYRIAQQGIGLVPEGRQIFPNLSARENLVATAANRFRNNSPWTVKTVLDMFPELRERQTSMGSLLSGGEQQMLAIGRALMTNPKLLILDEATEGLAPLIRQEIWSCLGRIKDEGLSILVIDKNVRDLCRIADRHHIIEKGKIVWTGSNADLESDDGVLERYLGV